MTFNLLLMGALAVLFIFVLARVVKKGLGRDFSEHKKEFEERLRKTGAETRDRNISAPAGEQLRLITAAARELLDLADNPPGFELLEEGDIVRLVCPRGEARISFRLMLPRPGKQRENAPGRWVIEGPGTRHGEFADPAGATAAIRNIIETCRL